MAQTVMPALAPPAKEPAAPRVLEGLKARIAAITGLLVGVPALINAGVDVYSAMARLPRSDAEQQNVQLFKKYFGKPPLVVNALPIRSTIGVVEMRFSVYEEGEIHVEYGNDSQWFAVRPASTHAAAGWLPFVPLAQAQATPARPPRTGTDGAFLKQSETLENSVLTRRRELAPGRVEEVQFDIRTGKVLSRRLIDSSTFSGQRVLKVPGTTILKEVQVDRGGG